MVLVTWLAKESYTIWTKSSMKLSCFLTNLGYFGLKSKELMSGVERSQFRRSKWPLNGLFSMVYGWWFSQGCLIHSLKSWDFSFLFFSSSRPVNTLTVKSALFEFELKALQNYLVKIIFGFLGSEYLNLVANFESYWIFQNLFNLEFEFRNVKL